MAVASLQRAVPVRSADDATRVSYLRKVAGLTLVGLLVSAFTGTLSAVVIASAPGIFFNQFVSLAVIFGSYAIAHYGARSMVMRGGTTAYAGFFVGAGFQGIAMGYLLLTAVLVSSAGGGNPFGLIMTAMGLVVLVAGGMVAWLMTGPKQVSYLGGMLSMTFLPMLAIMGLSFVMPSLFGGVFGIIIAGVFVVISAAGLLYNLNSVVHQFRTDMVVQGAYVITMGLLVLFWNVLSLITRLNRN